MIIIKRTKQKSMKLKIAKALLLVAVITLASCNKSNFNSPAGTVGISKIVYFPLIQIKGDRFLTLTQGGSFTDPGASATLNGDTTSFTVSGSPGSVDPNTPGVYTLTYTAKNQQGFTATDWRMVVVVPTSVGSDPIASTNDFSGTYLRAATGVTSTWTKIATGVYMVENAGGASSGKGNLVIAVNFSGNTISIPAQADPYYGGTVSSSSETYNASATPVTYSWVFHAPNYGTSLRTFTKQ
jgi:hypothetical protein